MEFRDAFAATAAMETLKGYLMDRDDPESTALRISFSNKRPSGAGVGARARAAEEEEEEERGEEAEAGEGEEEEVPEGTEGTEGEGARGARAGELGETRPRRLVPVLKNSSATPELVPHPPRINPSPSLNSAILSLASPARRVVLS